MSKVDTTGSAGTTSAAGGDSGSGTITTLTGAASRDSVDATMEAGASMEERGSTEVGGTMGVYERMGAKLGKLGDFVLRAKGAMGEVRAKAPSSMADGVGGRVRGHCRTAN